MRSLLLTIVSGMLGAGLAFTSAAQEVAGSPADQNIPVSTPAGTASGYPPAGGKGPGSGQSYRQGTAGPGQGSPNYQGGRAAEQAPPVDASTGNLTPDREPVPSTNITSGVVTPDAAPASADSLPAVPGPYSRPTGQDYPYYSGSTRPYSGGRGRGYGRQQRGYGYGYPGYRGLGGGQYPHHRQFGNPPMYPAQPATGAPPTTAE